MNDNCYPLNIKAVKERPILDEIITEVAGSRMSGDKLVLPMLKNEIEAVRFGDLWNKNWDMERALALYQKLLEHKVKKTFKAYDMEAMRPLAYELKLIKIALMVIRADKPEGARFAWAKVESSPYKPLVYAAIFMASIISIRCCIHPKADDGRETRLYPDEKGEHDVAWRWEFNGVTFVMFLRNSHLYVEQDGKLRKPTNSEYQMFHESGLNKDGARLASDTYRVMDLTARTGMALPHLKTWFEKRGFRHVEVEGYYGDVFKHFEPRTLIQSFDVVFINSAPINLSVSYVHRALRLLKPGGFIVLRYRKDQRNFMSVSALMEFAKDNNLSVSIVNSMDMPDGDIELYKTAYLIQVGKFSWRHAALNAQEFFENITRGARLAEVAA